MELVLVHFERNGLLDARRIASTPLSEEGDQVQREDR